MKRKQFLSSGTQTTAGRTSNPTGLKRAGWAGPTSRASSPATAVCEAELSKSGIWAEDKLHTYAFLSLVFLRWGSWGPWAADWRRSHEV